MASCSTITTPELVRKDCATWPESERKRWLDLFLPRGAFAKPPWVRQTAYQKAGVYSRYLAAVRSEGLPLDITPDGLRLFVRRSETRGCSKRTIAGYVWALYQIACLLHPEMEWSWLAVSARRMENVARRTPKQKNAKVVDATALYQLGMGLIADARKMGPGAGWPAVQKYRDGLWLCLGVCAPERRRALTAIKLDDIDLDARHIEFGPDDTKTKQSSLRTYPEEVAQYVREWINVYRAIYNPLHDHLWVAKGGRPAGAAALYMAMRKATGGLVDGGTSPHRFRDASATLLVEAGAELAPLAGVVLAHSSKSITQEYTETARRFDASRQVNVIFQAAKAAIAKAARATTRSKIALFPKERPRN